MQGREKLLIAVTVVVILLWQGMPLYNRFFVEPITIRTNELLKLEDEIAQRERTQRSIRRAHTNLVAWRQKSLPVDTLNAQRLYLEWLTDMANLSGFTEVKVTPPKTTARAGKVFTPLQVKIDARGTYEQLCRFLEHVHKGELLHRIAEMDIKVPKEGEKDKLTISLTAEGIAVKGSEKQGQLLPRTELSEQVSGAATTLKVAGVEHFPKQTPFLARSGTEILKVTNVSDAGWTVERGADSTQAADHGKGDFVELFHVIPKQPVTTPDLQLVVAGNLFTKPRIDNGPSDPLDGPYAQNTWLRQLWSVNDEWEARLLDQSNQTKILHKGSIFQIDNLQATVAEIHPDHLMVQIGESTKRLNLGNNLQSMKGEGGGGRGGGMRRGPRSEGDGGGSGGGEGRGRNRGGPGGERRMRGNFDPNDPRVKEFRERMKRGEFGDPSKFGGKFGGKRGGSGGGDSEGSESKSEGSSESTTTDGAATSETATPAQSTPSDEKK